MTVLLKKPLKKLITEQLKSVDGEDPMLTFGMDPEVRDVRTAKEAEQVFSEVMKIPKGHVFGLDVEWERPDGYDDKEGHLRATAFSWQLSAGDKYPELSKVFFRNWGPHAGHGLRIFKKWFADPAVLKTGHNFRSDRHVFKKHGIEIDGFYADGQDLDWLLDEQLRENRHGLKECVIDHLGYTEDDAQEYRDWFSHLPDRRMLKSGKLSKVPTKKVAEKHLKNVVRQVAGTWYEEGGIARLANYAVKDPLYSLRLLDFYIEQLSAIPWAKDMSLWDYYQRFERPYWHTLWNCENRGLPVNTEFLEDLSEVIDSKAIDVSKRTFRGIARALNNDNSALQELVKKGQQFSIGSKDQMKKLLFGKLGLKSVKETKPTKKFPNGQPQLDDVVVDVLTKKHPEYADILVPYSEYGGLIKLNSTYVLSFIDKCAKAWDNNLHTSLRRTLTTGRLSSSQPNLQNLPDPAKGTDNFGVRDSVEAPDGWMLICGDMSQIEMRLLAHFAKDESLLDCFNSDPEKDTHCEAARWLFPELAKMTDSEIKKADKEKIHLPDGTEIPGPHAGKRSIAKAINFGLAYGMTEHKLGRDMNKSVEEALVILKRYFQKYRGVHKWIEGTKAYVKQNEHVRTYLRRYARFQGIRTATFKEAKGMERSAVNAVIQGSAADLIMLAMLIIDNTVPNAIGEELASLGYKLLMQVHDELLGMCPTENAERCEELVRKAMGDPYTIHGLAPLRCPTPADVGRGKTWYEAKH